MTIAQRWDVPSLDLVSPGISEASRAILRQRPRLLLLRSPSEGEARHLRRVAAERRVPVVIDPDMPLGAALVAA